MSTMPQTTLTAMLVTCSLLAGAVQAADGQPTEARRPPMPKLQGPIFNQDCTDLFYSHTIKAGVDGGAVIDQYVDVLAEAGVTVLMCNTNARKTNYKSGVWETFWDGYDPNGPDDQPFFKPIAPAEAPAWRRLVHSMWAVDNQGVDYPARMIARSRVRGISPWVSLRMNDVHCNDRLDHPFHGKLWRDPQYHRGGSMGYYQRGLDYAHPEVRDMYRALIVETLARYDIDGLELDFMREPYLFHEGAEAEGARILLAWLQDVRRLVDDAAARRGHPVRLGVRVPSHPEVAVAWGLDAVGWAKLGLVDLVVATPRWATLEYDMPLGKWRQLLEGTGATLAGGLETLLRPCQNSPAHSTTPEQAAGAATAVLAGGADAVYLFNYFVGTASSPAWGQEGYRRTLRAMSSLGELTKLARRHSVTWRDILAPGEKYHPPLPAEGTHLAFDLPTGPAPVAGGRASLELDITVPAGAELTPPTVLVNTAATTFRSRAAAGENVVRLAYDIPANALPGDRVDRLGVNAADGKPVKVVRVEVRIAPPE